MNNITPKKRKPLAGSNDTPKKIQKLEISPVLRKKAEENNSPMVKKTEEDEFEPHEKNKADEVNSNEDNDEVKNENDDDVESEDENIAAEEHQGDDEVEVDNDDNVESEDKNIAAEDDEVGVENDEDIESEDKNIAAEDDEVGVENDEDVESKDENISAEDNEVEVDNDNNVESEDKNIAAEVDEVGVENDEDVESKDENIAAEEHQGDDEVEVNNDDNVEYEDKNIAAEDDEVGVENDEDVESKDENIAAEDNEVEVDNDNNVESEDKNIAAEDDEVGVENDEDVEFGNENIGADEKQDDNDEVESDNKTNDNTSKELVPKALTEYNSVFVTGLLEGTKLENVFKGCSIDTYDPQITEYGKLLGYFVRFKNKQSRTNAFFKTGTVHDGRLILVEPFSSICHEYFNVLVEGLSAESNIKNIFLGCKMEKTKKHWSIANAYLIKFAHENSIQKALLKNKTKHEDHILYVRRLNCSVTVTGLKSNGQIINFFRDCKGIANINETSPVIHCVSFNERTSLETALSLNGTEYDGETIIVTERRLGNDKPYGEDLHNAKQLLRTLQEEVLYLENLLNRRDE